MPRSTIARRMALIGATTAAATAVVSAVVPLLLLIWRLSAADARTADGLAEAVESGIARARQVIFAGRSFRIDGAGTDYPSSPLRRYEALSAMRYL